MKTPIEEIKNNILIHKEIRLFVKRDDLIHPLISGNKFRKLKYNLERARKENHHTLLTFGGAYSNHVYAVAAAGAIHGFNTIGIIRGEEYHPLNPTLTFAVEKGMKLHYVSREKYKNKYTDQFLQELREIFGPYYLVPEGGSNLEAIQGVIEMVKEIDLDMDVIAVSCGTGGTMAGILTGLEGSRYAIGFPVLRNGGFLREDIAGLIRSYNKKVYTNWHLATDYHFGGYARYNMELIHFINDFNQQFRISLDPVYTGKMMYGIFDLIHREIFKKGQKILAIHTGGLQGIQGFNERFGNLIV
jgi:1-aminocyclopropane-1-carboxylate deaminase/D-cysteine desulfhydrase-like pyridoxal-dependent ACC family enzyme